MNIEKMREQFELEAKKHFVSVPGVRNWLSRRANGDYQFERVHLAWIFWQASREAVVVELPEPETLDVDCDESLEMEPEEYEVLEASHGARWSEHSRLKKAIEAQGLKVAP